MKSKRKEWLKLYFLVTGSIALLIVIGKIGNLQLDNITIRQALPVSIIAVIYFAVSVMAYKVLDGHADEYKNGL